MADLGCHAGHGRHKNMSDALLWLHYFNSSGSVLGVDAFDDYALDLQHRFDDVEPYKSMTRVRKRGALAILGPRDGVPIDSRGMHTIHLSCCGGEWCRAWAELEASGVHDHHCRITRQRLGLSPSSLPLPPSSYTRRYWRWAAGGRKGAAPKEGVGPSAVTTRADTLLGHWLPEGARLDLLKIDVDMPPSLLGLQQLFEKRRFRVMVIEIDGSWNDGVDLEWQVSSADQLIWLARKHDYEAYLKVPCSAGERAWYWLLPAQPVRLLAEDFKPHGTQAQDLMLVDRAEPRLGERLEALGNADCARTQHR